MENKISRIEFLRLFGAGALSITPFGRSLLSITDDPHVLTTIAITPPTANLVVGQQQLFTVTGVSNPEWEASGGTFVPNGMTCTYTARDIGDFVIKCREAGTPTWATAAIHTTGTTPELTTIVITPATANLVVGGPVATFVAEGKDQFNATYPLSNPLWTTSGGGTLSPGGTSCTYAATAPGTFILTCTEGGTTVKGTATIHTTGTTPALTTIVITPASANLVAGGPVATFVAEGKDQYNQTYPISSPVWATSGGGTLSPGGTSCTYTPVQKGRHTITCRQNGTSIQGTANIHTGHHIYMSMVSR